MTQFLNEAVRAVEGIVDLPLEFTRNLAGVFQSHVIAAFNKPIPKDDPISSYRYLNSRRQVLIDAARQRPLVRMQDKNYLQLATIANERSCRFEEIAADSGEAGVVIRGGDYLGDFVRNAVRIEEDLHLSIDPIGTQPDWKTRWGGKITEINVKRDSQRHPYRRADRDVQSGALQDNFDRQYAVLPPGSTANQNVDAAGQHSHRLLHHDVHQPGPAVLPAAVHPDQHRSTPADGSIPLGQTHF